MESAAPSLFALSLLDWVIVTVYLALVFSKGFLFYRRDADADDFFLAGRSLGWGLIGLSLFASNISSSTLIGLSGSAYKSGISISNYEWMAAPILVFGALFVFPVFLHSRLATAPEYLEKRFGRGLRSYFSILTLLGNIFIDTAGTLFAGSLVVTVLIPELSLFQAALLLGLASGIYTAFGGFRAVVVTDAVQAIVLLVGSTLLTVLALESIDSFTALREGLSPSDLSLIQPNDDPTMPWLGFLIGVPILGFYFWCTNQFIVQRVLAAKNREQALWGSLLAGFLKIFVVFVMVFPGLLGRFLFPDLASPDLVFPTMVTELLPVGARGIILAALIAAIMSSLDSTLNAAATLLTYDFVSRSKFWGAPKRLALLGRVFTILFMLIAIAWVPVVSGFGTLFEYLQSGLAYLFPPVAAVFVLGLFAPRVGARAALFGMVIGHMAAVSVFLVGVFTEAALPHFLKLAGIFFALALLTALLVSRRSSGSESAEPTLLALHPSSVFSELSASELFGVGAVLLMTALFFLLFSGIFGVPFGVS